VSLRAAVLVFLAALPAAAQTEIAPFAGVQAWGALSVDGEETALDPAPTFGVMVSFDRGPGRRLDVLLSHQNTSAERQDPFEPVVSADVGITYAQLGGRYFVSRRAYIAATVGGTVISVGGNSALGFSFSAGGGVEIPIRPALALRLDGRLYNSLVNASAEIACDSSGVCTSFTDGGSMSQFAGTAALVFRF
jgi:hypothetical protein